MHPQKFVDLFARGADVSLPVAERDVVLTYVLRILARVSSSEGWGMSWRDSEVCVRSQRAAYWISGSENVLDGGE